MNQPKKDIIWSILSYEGKISTTKYDKTYIYTYAYIIIVVYPC